MRDRAYIYWRMLSTSPQNTKQVVLSEKPHIADDSYNQYDDALVSALIDQISTLGSIYHKTEDDLALMQKRALGTVPQQSVTPQPRKEEEKESAEIESSATAAAASAEEKKEKKKSKQRKDSSEGEEETTKKEKVSKKTTKIKKTKDEPVAVVEPAQPPTTAGIIDIDDLLGMGDS